MNQSRERPPPVNEVAELGSELRALVERPQLRDAFRALFARDVLAVSVGWPRLARSAGARASWLRAGDVWIELARSPAAEPVQVALSWGADSAVQLVDAVLGGRVESHLASASGQPSEAECGVLAYAVARLLVASGEAWLLRDVRVRGEDDVWLESAVVWPLSLRMSAGALEGALWLSPALAANLGAHRVTIALSEQLASGALAGLARSDVWLCESSPVTLTSRGLVGPVVLSVAGSQTQLAAQLTDGRVRARGLAVSLPGVESVELVLGSRTLGLLELAELAEGALTQVECDGRAELRRAGVTLARGELIMWRGQLGLRITEL